MPLSMMVRCSRADCPHALYFEHTVPSHQFESTVRRLGWYVTRTSLHYCHTHNHNRRPTLHVPATADQPAATEPRPATVADPEPAPEAVTEAVTEPDPAPAPDPTPEPQPDPVEEAPAASCPECSDMFADMLPHTVTGHRLMYLLTDEGITTASQLSSTPMSQLAAIKGVGPVMIATLTQAKGTTDIEITDTRSRGSARSRTVPTVVLRSLHDSRLADDAIAHGRRVLGEERRRFIIEIEYDYDRTSDIHLSRTVLSLIGRIGLDHFRQYDITSLSRGSSTVRRIEFSPRADDQEGLPLPTHCFASDASQSEAGRSVGAIAYPKFLNIPELAFTIDVPGVTVDDIEFVTFMAAVAMANRHPLDTLVLTDSTYAFEAFRALYKKTHTLEELDLPADGPVAAIAEQAVAGRHIPVLWQPRNTLDPMKRADRAANAGAVKGRGRPLTLAEFVRRHLPS